MKSDFSVSNGKSLFSVVANPQPNHLHQFYHQLLGDCDYPLLARILFLQLVTRQNVLLYSSRRAEVKEAWTGLAKQLKDTQASVYAVDPDSKIQEILTNKGERRVLLFDLGKIGTSGINFLLNNTLPGITILAVQDESRPIRSQLSDLFPIVFLDQQYSNPDITTNPPSNAPFDRQKFQASIAANFALSAEIKEENSFFKTYLAMLKERSHNLGVQVPLSRWKKMAMILRLIGTSRTEGAFKHMAPTDCLLAPECLGRTPQELQALSKANEQTLLKLIPMFGVDHWIKQLGNHFWVPPARKDYFLSLAAKLKGKVSFFYPCSRYSDFVRLLADQQHLYYRITGHDKKLLNDKYLSIDPQKSYTLTFSFRCPDQILLHAGIACYDSQKKLISPIQVCRFQNSAVRIQSINGRELIVIEEDRHALTNWKQSGSFAYQRCLGFYANGHIDQLLNQEDVLFSEEQPYQKEDGKGIFTGTNDKAIILTEKGSKHFKKLQGHFVSGITRVMNHYQGGTYAIGGSYKGIEPTWKKIQLNFKGQGRTNNGKQFLVGTKWARIAILANFNNGFPDFTVSKKQAQVDITEIEWIAS